MKSFAIFASFSGLLGAAVAGNSCVAPDPTCALVPAESSAACSSVISSAKIKTSTCTVPSSTSVVSKYTTPVTTTTVQTTSTRTIQKTFHRSEATQVTTTTITVTATSTATSTETSVTHEPSVSTTTTTVQAGYPNQCPVGKKKRAPAAIPSDCSCFLTTTATAGVTTTTTTITQPTSTVTKYSIAQETVTETYFGTTVVNTEIATTTSTSTTTTVTTVTSTTTDVSTETQTVTLPYDPCSDENIHYFTQSISAASSPAIVWGMMGDSDGPQDCCYATWGGGRAYVAWHYANRVCTSYMEPNNSPRASANLCHTSTCPQGVTPLLLGAATGNANDVWGVSQCAGSLAS